VANSYTQAVSETPAVERSGWISRLLRRPVDAVGGAVVALALALEDFFRDRGPQYAAAIAFHVLFSLFPLTILLVSIFGLVLQDDELRATVIDELLAVLRSLPRARRTCDGRSSRSPRRCPRSASCS